MLTNLLRLVVFAAIAIAVLWAVNWLVLNGGEVPIVFRGAEYRPSLVSLIVAGLLGVIALYVLWWIVGLGVAILSFFLGDNNAITKFFRRRNQRRGMVALTDTVIALANGDGKSALANAQKANRRLSNPVLTGLMVAEAAKREGKLDVAEAAYKGVLAHDAGRFPAIRGLMQERLARGDKDTARQLAQKALEIKPDDNEVIDALLDMQIEAGEWDAARKTLKAKTKAEKLPADIVKRREAVFAICEARSLDREVDAERYSDRVMLAHRLAPNLVPAAILAAEAKANEGNMRAADTILVKAWNADPHPELAAAYANLVPDEEPEQRLRRFKVLIRRQKDHPETQMLHAELLIAAEDFPGARRALGELAENPDTARVLALMAAIEHGEGSDEHVVRAYLARAARASRGPQWVCNDCGHVHGEWEAECEACGHFDTFEWKVPPENPADERGFGAILPMLERRSDRNAVAEVVEEAEIIEDAAIESD